VIVITRAIDRFTILFFDRGANTCYDAEDPLLIGVTHEAHHAADPSTHNLNTRDPPVESIDDAYLKLPVLSHSSILLSQKTKV
jgi:hypothetical protein